MKIFLFPFPALLFCGISSFAQESTFEKRTIEILPGSSLSISGTTNIDGFESDFNTLYFQDQDIIVNYSKKRGVLNFKNNVLPLENEKFDCGNR